MDSRSELFWRAILAIFAVFVVGKLVAYFLKSAMDSFLTFDKGKKKQDFDEEIDRMVDKIKKGAFGQVSGTTSNKAGEKKGEGLGPGSGEEGQHPQAGIKGESKPKANFLEQHYQDVSARLAQVGKEKGEQSAEYLDLKEVVGLFDNARWGSGKVFQSLTQQLEKNLKMSEAFVDLGPLVVELIREEAFWVKGSENGPRDLLGSADALNLVKSRFTLEVLIKDAQNKGEKFFSILAKQYQKDVTLLLKAFDLAFWKGAGKPTSYLLDLALHKSAGEDLRRLDTALKKKILMHILMPGSSLREGKVVHFTEILHQVKKRGDQLEKLETLKADFSDEEDLQADYELLGCTPANSEEEIKSAFNKMAKRTHPDRMSNMQLTEEKIKTVNERFGQIKEAHDRIKEVLKKRRDLLKVLEE